jgi:hypothetical protein
MRYFRVETLHATSLRQAQLYVMIYQLDKNAIFQGRDVACNVFARGIAAEPATKARRAEVADGADSPTRGAKPRSGSPKYNQE